MFEKLKVGLTYDFSYEAFKDYIPNLEIITGNVSEYDLIIFPGGEDISPARYNSHPTYTHSINDLRDRIEFHIMNTCVHSWGRATTGRRPKILGVCRGHQLVNVYYGSPLIQDIGIELRLPHAGRHGLEIREGSPLPEIFPYGVNSYHHQGVTRPGVSLKATSYHKNIVESTEGDGIFTVQCHPESMGDYGIPFFQYVEKWVLSTPKRAPKKNEPETGALEDYIKKVVREQEERNAFFEAVAAGEEIHVEEEHDFFDRPDMDEEEEDFFEDVEENEP